MTPSCKWPIELLELAATQQVGVYLPFFHAVVLGFRKRRCRNLFIRDLKICDGDVSDNVISDITLLYHESLAIIPSCSRHTLLAKYPEDELVREISG